MGNADEFGAVSARRRNRREAVFSFRPTNPYTFPTLPYRIEGTYWLGWQELQVSCSCQLMQNAARTCRLL